MRPSCARASNRSLFGLFSQKETPANELLYSVMDLFKISMRLGVARQTVNPKEKRRLFWKVNCRLCKMGVVGIRVFGWWINFHCSWIFSPNIYLLDTMRNRSCVFKISCFSNLVFSRVNKIKSVFKSLTNIVRYFWTLLVEKNTKNSP